MQREYQQHGQPTHAVERQVAPGRRHGIHARQTPKGRATLYCDGQRLSPVLVMAQAETETDPIARNRRARHDYHILETWEAGLVLTGTEVKALRNGRATISDAYAVVNSGEVFLLNLHIGQYDQGH